MADPASLPFVDEHARTVAATPERAWEALARVLPRATDRTVLRGFARVVGCDPVGTEGLFPSEGAAMPGFRVALADPPRALLLAGSHRFSRYELDVRLEPLDDGRRTRLVARTNAAFPGRRGAAYRLAVIGSGGHALALKALLASVARAAERPRR